MENFNHNQENISQAPHEGICTQGAALGDYAQSSSELAAPFSLTNNSLQSPSVTAFSQYRNKLSTQSDYGQNTANPAQTKPLQNSSQSIAQTCQNQHAPQQFIAHNALSNTQNADLADSFSQYFSNNPQSLPSQGQINKAFQALQMLQLLTQSSQPAPLTQNFQNPAQSPILQQQSAALPQFASFYGTQKQQNTNTATHLEQERDANQSSLHQSQSAQTPAPPNYWESLSSEKSNYLSSTPARKGLKNYLQDYCGHLDNDELDKIVDMAKELENQAVAVYKAQKTHKTKLLEQNRQAISKLSTDSANLRGETPTKSRAFTRSEISKMNMRDFLANQSEILSQYKKGEIS